MLTRFSCRNNCLLSLDLIIISLFIGLHFYVTYINLSLRKIHLLWLCSNVLVSDNLSNSTFYFRTIATSTLFACALVWTGCALDLRANVLGSPFIILSEMTFTPLLCWISSFLNLMYSSFLVLLPYFSGAYSPVVLRLCIVRNVCILASELINWLPRYRIMIGTHFLSEFWRLWSIIF